MTRDTKMISWKRHQSMETNEKKLDFIKTNNSFKSKDIINRLKKVTHRMGENICQSYTSWGINIHDIYKTLKIHQQKSKQLNWKKWAKTQIDISSKKIQKLPVGT